jgi:predicted nucleic acid-binding protein
VSVFIVDASVVVKWFVPEAHSDAARALLDVSHQYAAPDLLFAETAHVLWKKARRGEISARSAKDLVDAICASDVESIPSRVLAADAQAMALVTGQTVYDALYLALAVRLDTRLITADERLHHAIQPFAILRPHVAHVASFHG